MDFAEGASASARQPKPFPSVWLGMPLPSYSAGCLAILATTALVAVARPSSAADSAGWWLDQAEVALHQAESFEADHDERAVDAYFSASRAAWQASRHCLTDDSSHRDNERAWRIYHEAVAGLVLAGQASGRLDPCRELLVKSEGAAFHVPIVRHGFAWREDDFQRFSIPPHKLPGVLRTRYATQGVGVPLVVQRKRRADDPIDLRFFPERSAFAATAVLRFLDPGATGATGEPATAVLELYDPLRIRSVPCGGVNSPLASDITAPLAIAVESNPRTYLAGFVQPGSAAAPANLQFLEPYQRGKAPVVLIHGLLSDPQSFADLTNDLRAVPGFSDRFQIWAFRYPTGQSFLRSAAVLRAELKTAVQICDPEDPALTNISLIGHSMGGLVAKLQVTHSDDRIWRQLANRPLEAIATSDAIRAQLAEIAYFDPVPQVRRVVFLATPHSGATRTSQAVGVVASRLVEPTPEDARVHAQLLRDNPGTFAPYVQERLPTSIDLLGPDSPLLTAMRKLRVGSCVSLHTVAGVAHPLSLDGPTDGVVPVRAPGIPAQPASWPLALVMLKFNRHPSTVSEIWRILQSPADAGQAVTPPSPW